MASTDTKSSAPGAAPGRVQPTSPRSTPGQPRPLALPWPLDLIRRGNPAALAILLAALVIGTYLPSLDNGFISLDDPVYVSANAHVQQGLTWSGVRWAFTAVEASLWHPVTWLSLMLDSQLLGHAPFDYHLTNLVLHTANAVLLFLLLFRLTGAPWRSASVAALFGVHPLHVESVAWISERKDVLSTFFFLLTLWAYVRYAKVEKQKAENRKLKGEVQELGASTLAPSLRSAELRRGQQALPYYALALGFFALGLLSKPMLVTTPVILLLLDFWPLGRLDLSSGRPASSPSPKDMGHSSGTRRSSFAILLLEKVPFFALSLVFSLVTMYAQRGAGSFMTSTELPVAHRLDNALLTCIHYLVQIFWPGRYAMYYPYPLEFSTAAVGLAVLLLALISGAALWNLHRRPYLAFGWVWYLVTLLPVVGLIQVGNQAQADRYTYIPLIGIFLLLVWTVSENFKFRIPYFKLNAGAAIGAGCVLLCVPFTVAQIGYWHDSETLARHALEVTQDNPVALNIYGIALSKKGQLDEAIRCWREAVRIAPHYAHAAGNLGAALFRKGQLDESIYWTRQAIQSKPGLAGAYANLGAALGVKGRLDEAIAALQQAERLAPGEAQTHFNLGYALQGKGRYDDAIREYEETLRLAPEHPAARRGLQEALAAKAKAGRH